MCAFISRLLSRHDTYDRDDVAAIDAEFLQVTAGRLRLIMANPQDDRHVAIVYDALRERSAVAQSMLMEYVLHEVLYHVASHDVQVIGNAQNLGSMFAFVQGYSGTIENQFVMPHDIHRHGHDGIIMDDGANGQVICRLRQLRHLPIVRARAGGSGDRYASLASRILSAIASDDLCALIDIGAHIRGRSNLDVTCDILMARGDRATAVIYFDENANRIMCLCRCSSIAEMFGSDDGGDADTIVKALPSTTRASIESISGVRIDSGQLFTYYDQWHITGTDIPQLAHGLGLATVSIDTPLRHLLQGVMRMRRLLTTQRVQFVAAEESAVWSDGMAVDHLIRSCQVVQFAQERNENRRCVIQKLDDVVRTATLDAAYRSTEHKDLEAAYRSTRTQRLWRTEADRRVDARRYILPHQ